MSNADTPVHLYQRSVSDDRHDSLSIIASLIEPGQTVLDLGMGTGALGHYLSERHNIVVDGVTMNPAEADIARTWYRSAMVADLDRDDIGLTIGDQRYDCIVCADVLEHLKDPQNILAQCKTLLNPGGRLLTSVPNAGYCGLVAELIQGEFRYRPEGLLDRTHLRFFTRTSLKRFFDDCGWITQFITVTERNLLMSEFKVAFDCLPPAVARYLLATPEALTYQFISVLHPVDMVLQSETSRSAPGAGTAEEAKALFSAQLYLGVQGKFDESKKIVAAGRIGDPWQTLTFNIPTSPEPYTNIRFDPADRPGFFRLHHLQVLLPSNEVLWQWTAGQDPLVTLADAPQHQILLSSPWTMSAGALLLLHGDDPWLELPLAPELLQVMAKSGGRLEVGAGWPMSADYLQASASVNALEASHQQSLSALRRDLERVNTNTLSLAMDVAQEEKLQLIEELHAAQRDRNVFLAQFDEMTQHLKNIEQSTVFRLTRPLVNVKMKADRLLGRSIELSSKVVVGRNSEPISTSPYAVDIIVPVFRGLDDTRLCLESVLASRCQTLWRLIVINDCSPEQEVTEFLRVFVQRDPRIILLENAENLGFVATVNRGMALNQDGDVLLLNSDAEVANDWLDRIQQAAYSGPRVASVTPFSNNATICSYPRFCESNVIPDGHDTASLDRVFALHLAGQTVEVPTGIGFCMYIRRQCLREIGLFDVENFGKGYGEENDFCIRAQQAGWTNLHALDTFVRHAGGVSFGDTKSGRELQAIETMRRLHPKYESDVHAFVQRDTARLARMTIDLARITASSRPVVLNVSHNREGGTLRHIQELVEQLGAQATFLRLSPAPGGVELRLEGIHEAFALRFALPQEQPTMLKALRQLQVSHIHFHHLLGHLPSITELPSQLGVTHDFTAHDYYSYCPQISLTDHTDRYCGELGIDQCRQCLKRNPAPGHESIESWRDRHARLLSQARHVIAPSFDVAQRMKRFVPTARIECVPHSVLNSLPPVHPKPSPRLLSNDQPLRIVVLGALSKIKGADLLEEVAIQASRLNLPLEFHLLGYAYRSLRTQPKARLTIHGGYEEKDLQLLLQWLQPDAVWFPAQCPETYSYTLSAALESGLPVIAPNIGAFSERLQNREWTWLSDWQPRANQWVEFFNHIRQHNFSAALSPPPIPAFTGDSNGIKLTPLYRSSYLQNLPTPVALSLHQLDGLQQVLLPNFTSSGIASQSLALRILVRLRTSQVLSPLSRIVPMHLQRRIKSWLQS